MKAICVDPSGTTVLKKNREYFLFKRGSGLVYVSKFQNEKAHFGCFQESRFQMVGSSWPPEPDETIPELDRNKTYKARLVWRREGYKGKPLKDYYLQPLETHAYFYHDAAMKECCGCFPLHWFADFVEVEKMPIPDPVVEVLDDSDPDPEKFEQLSLF